MVPAQLFADLFFNRCAHSVLWADAWYHVVRAFETWCLVLMVLSCGLAVVQNCRRVVLQSRALPIMAAAGGSWVFCCCLFVCLFFVCLFVCGFFFRRGGGRGLLLVAFTVHAGMLFKQYIQVCCLYKILRCAVYAVYTGVLFIQYK